jgi:hypothetical protein
LTKEMEQIEQAIETINTDELQARYEKMSASFRTGTVIEGIEITEDDVIIEGRSTKDLVSKIIMMENRMVQFVRLLVPETGTLDDITYEEIDAEWPMAIQLEMLAKITESIQPGYKDARKN